MIRTVPIIKKVDFFDPQIYQVIKKNPQLLKTMDWRLFEEMLADILRKFKYSVELTKPTKDGGIDIFAIKHDDNFGMHKYLLQAKRYSEAVQVSPVRELLFLHDEHRATKSCLATTASFTKGAWELAESHKWKMELKDQEGILQWINKITN
ncbi:MAG: restriction endonuclease [Chryseobacterium sp.]|nr:MAG: restriction endonuclease [Chryseobacterium sp.]